jgi:K+-transporting ATPase KdpF subunit
LLRPATSCRADLQVGLFELQRADLKVGVTGGLMDYIIAGLAALFLFAYLVYALLRPEKF